MIKKLILQLFNNEYNKTISIPYLVKKSKFNIALKENGVYIDKLERGEIVEGDTVNKGIIEWAVFDEVINFIRSKEDHKAIKGSAQGGNLLNFCVEFNTSNIEGYIANKCYNVKLGEKGVRRVTYYGSILKAIGLVENDYKCLKLNERFTFNTDNTYSDQNKCDVSDDKQSDVYLNNDVIAKDVSYVHKNCNSISCFDKFNSDDIKRALDRKEMYLGVAKYTFIMDIFWEVNVYKDNTFKVVFIDFYKLNINTDVQFLDRFFEYLEYNKVNELKFIDVLRYLYKYSGKIHGSFASKLLATVNPKLPIIDKFIRNHLDLEFYCGKDNVNKIVAQYNQIIDIYDTFLQTEQSRVWIQMFDEKFPYNRIEDIKKIDFILWQIR